MRTVKRGIFSALVVAVVFVGAAGCGAEPSADATPAASALECPKSPIDPVSAEQAATCVYQGWIQGDEALAVAYRRAGTLDDLPTVMADPKLTLAGCSEDGGDKISGLACIWKGTNTEGPVSVEMGMTGSDTDGFRVSATAIVHN